MGPDRLAGYGRDVVEAAERHNAAFTITARKYTNVCAAMETLARDPDTVWNPALGTEDGKGSQVAETMSRFAGRDLRLIVRRQPIVAGDPPVRDGEVARLVQGGTSMVTRSGRDR